MRTIYFFILFFCTTTLVFAETIHFKKNSWNFVGFQNTVNIEKDPFLNSSRSQIVWTYENNTWNAFSNIAAIKKKLAEQNFKKISKIYSYQGVWVYSNANYNYIQTNPLSPSKTLSTSGWNLISSPSGSKIDVTQVTNAKRIFVYRNNNWFAHFHDNTNNPYNKLNSIEATEAYWVYLEEKNTQNSNNSQAISFPSLPSELAPPQPSI